jgi:hypothetical protein
VPSAPDRALDLDEALRRLDDGLLARGRQALFVTSRRAQLEAARDGHRGVIFDVERAFAWSPVSWQSALVALDAFAEALADVEQAQPRLDAMALISHPRPMPQKEQTWLTSIS